MKVSCLGALIVHIVGYGEVQSLSWCPSWTVGEDNPGEKLKSHGRCRGRFSYHPTHWAHFIVL